MAHRLLASVVSTVLIVLASATAQSATEVEKLFARAQQKATSDGDLPGAIELYRQVVESKEATRTLRARSLLGIGDAHEKLSSSPDARAAYARLLNEFADVREVTALAKERLAAIDVREQTPIRVRQPAAAGVRRASPDGRFVAFQQMSGSENRRTISLAVRDAATGTERILVPNLRGSLNLIRFSPTGRHVAAIVLVQPQVPKRYQEQLVVADVTGSRPPIVLDAAMDDTKGDWERLPMNWKHLAWSPDGARLPYLAPAGTAGRSEAKVLTVGTGASESLGSVTEEAADFTWSPGGDRLAMRVANRTDGTDEIRVLTMATRQVRSLPNPEAGAKTKIVRWTTSNALALRTTKGSPLAAQVHLMDLDTGQSRMTCSGSIATDMGISLRAGDLDVCGPVTPSGASQLVWSARSKQLLVRDTSTLADRRLTRDSGEEHGGDLSPDGRLVAFLSNRNGQWGIYAVPLERSEQYQPVLLVKLDDAPGGFSVSWHDEAMIASAFVEETSLRRVPMDPASGKSTGPLERLTEDSRLSTGPSVSPDGRTIAYWSRPGTTLALSVMDVNGANERVVAGPVSGDAFMFPPSWSSNQEVVVASGAAQQWALQSVNVATGAVAVVAQQERSWGGVAYARERDELVYLVSGTEQKTVKGICCGTDAPAGATAGTHVFHARSLATGEVRDVASVADADGYVDSFVVSPDAGTIAYLFARGVADNKPGCRCELTILDTRTGQPRVIARDLAAFQVPVALSPDGGFLLYGAARPRIIDTSTGDSWPLMATPAAQPDWSRRQSGSWSPDGTFIVVPASTSRNESWQIEGATFETIVKLSRR